MWGVRWAYFWEKYHNSRKYAHPLFEEPVGHPWAYFQKTTLQLITRLLTSRCLEVLKHPQSLASLSSTVGVRTVVAGDPIFYFFKFFLQKKMLRVLYCFCPHMHFARCKHIPLESGSAIEASVFPSVIWVLSTVAMPWVDMDKEHHFLHASWR